MENFEEENEINILKDNLLIELFKDAEMPQNFELTDEQKDNFLRVLIVTRTNEPASEKLILAQDKFLKTFNEQQKINIDKLQFKNNIYLIENNVLNSEQNLKNKINNDNKNFNIKINKNENISNRIKENENNVNQNKNNINANNILNYNVDLLVVATNNAVEDVESLLAGKPSLDNEILFRAGVELKNELLKNANKNLIFAKGFNLNAKFIAKIVLKNLKDQNVCEILAENLKTVFEFIKEKELKSVAIDFNWVLNFDKDTNAKIFKDLQKTIENLNKKLKIKVILKNL